MCNGFGGYITQDAIYFCEPDDDGDCSHSSLARRLGWNEKTPFIRPVKFEFPDWTESSFRWDEDDTLPGWVTDEHQERAVKTLLRVAPAWGQYEQARATARAEYEKVRDAAWAEFKRVRAPAYAKYQQVRDTAYAKYQQVRDTAWAKYEKVRDTAWAKFISTISPITGYVPAK